MENGYRKYQELEGEGVFNDLYYKLGRDLNDARNLIGALQCKFEHIRGKVSQLDITGNTALTKTYSIQVSLDELSSEITQLSQLVPTENQDEQVNAYNENSQLKDFPIVNTNSEGVYIQSPFGETEYLTHAQYTELYNNRKRNGYS